MAGGAAAAMSTLLALAAPASVGARPVPNTPKPSALLVTPIQLEAAVGGAGFFYYTKPSRRPHAEPVGRDGINGSHLCPLAQGDYNEKIEGRQPGEDETGVFEIELFYFGSAQAAHRNFICLRGERSRLSTAGGDFTDLPPSRSSGQESFGGGGDDDAIGVFRQGKYVVWLEVQQGYGPLGLLGYDEATLIRDHG